MTVADYTDTPFARVPRLHHRDALAGPSSAGFARRNLVGMMGVMMESGAKQKTARDYVKSGLIAMWDGIENAGYGVHDASANTWKDLVGSYDLSILDGTTWIANAAVAGSSNGIARRASVIDQSLFGTIEICSHCPTAGHLLMNRSSSTNIIYIYNDNIDQDNSYSGMSYSRRTSEITTSKLTDTVFGVDSRTVSAVLNSSICLDSAYINGEKQTATKIFSGPGCFGNGFVIGASSNGYSNLISGMKVHSVRIYNRSITAAEIAANYAVDKARFGLT